MNTITVTTTDGIAKTGSLFVGSTEPKHVHGPSGETKLWLVTDAANPGAIVAVRRHNGTAWVGVG